MWIRKKEFEELKQTVENLNEWVYEERVRNINEREAVSDITKEWDTKREELIQQVVDLKIEIKEDEKIRRELHKFNAPIETVIKQVEWFRNVAEDTAKETREQIRRMLGRKNIPETEQYESEPLEAGVDYKISGDCFIGVVGIKFLEGTGYFEQSWNLSGTRYGGLKFTVTKWDLYKIFERGQVFPRNTVFQLEPLTKESKLKYTLIGTGFNNPKIEEVK